jgi:tRNA/rRNA methyltransferase
VADCTLGVGTGTLEHRRPEQTVLPLPELTPFVGAELARGGRVALVFGSEKRGLTREDFALCHLFVEIPTDPRQPSMNLGQAVAVCLYELTRAPHPVPSRPGAGTGVPPSATADERTADVESHVVASAPASSGDPACGRDLELLAGVIAETMQAANYSPAAMQKANRHDLDLLLRRFALARPDARRILGLFRRILWRLKRRNTLSD